MALFRNRADAGRQLAQRLKGRAFHDPLVLAIPRGGLMIGAALAKELGAELDVMLARRIRIPGTPHSSLGAVDENGRVVLDSAFEHLVFSQEHIAEERDFQLSLLARRRDLFRAVRPAAAVAGRSVIVTDDGISTGVTMIAALEVVRELEVREVIVAVPVARANLAESIKRRCHEYLCLHTPRPFRSIGDAYEGFALPGDADLAQLLGHYASQG